MSESKESNNVHKISTNEDYDGSATLVGTVHISNQTKKRVLDTIDSIDPDTVGIELDQERLHRFIKSRADEVNGEENSNRFSLKESLRKLQTNMLGDGEDVLSPGEADMMPAVNRGVEMDCDIALIDLSMNELKEEIMSNVYTDGSIDLELFDKSWVEVMDSISDYTRIKKEMMPSDGSGFEATELVDYMENATTEEIADQMNPLRALAPEVVEAMIDERDMNMAGNIEYLRKNGHETVAVMGRGHIQGVRNYLKNPDEIPDEYISEPDWYEYSTITID